MPVSVYLSARTRAHSSSERTYSACRIPVQFQLRASRKENECAQKEKGEDGKNENEIDSAVFALLLL